MKIVTVQQMREIEQQGFAAGVSYEQMMRTAAGGIAADIAVRFAGTSRRILGLIGKGNNGGDALIALTLLAEQGWTARAALLHPRADDPLVADFVQAGGQIIPLSKEAALKEKNFENPDLFLDGVYGIGFHLPLDESCRALFTQLRQVQQQNPRLKIMAVDCPSGIDNTTSEADAATLPADITYAIEAVKIGELRTPANTYIGELVHVPLKLPTSLPVYSTIQGSLLDAPTIASLLPSRPADGNKGTFGTVNLLGGCDAYTGAPVLAGKAAYRAGCGLVRLIVPSAVKQGGGMLLPEAIWASSEDLLAKNGAPFLEWAAEDQKTKGSLLIGPGWGQAAENSALIRAFLDQKQLIQKPIILDADALNLIAALPDWETSLPECTILTPHPGEMARLCRSSVADVQRSRIELARDKAATWNATLVLKGANTIIAAPDGRFAILPFANSILAKAGSGDVLAGMIASFAAQGVSAFDAACLGVAIHGKAASLLCQHHGHAFSGLATDVIELIPESIQFFVDLAADLR